MDLFDVLFAKKLSGGGSPFPPVIKRVTGNPIEFSDGADAPLVKCTTAIQGNQDLHGYDKPWVGGSGKNKLNLSFSDDVSTISGLSFSHTDSQFKLVGTATTPSYHSLTFSMPPNVALNTDYTFSITVEGTIPSGLFSLVFYNGSTAVAQARVNTTDSKKKTFQVTSSYDKCVLLMESIQNGGAYNCTIKTQLELGSTATTFAPYSNICPITAYTEGEIEVRGKNLFDKTATDTSNGYRNNYNLRNDGREVFDSDLSISEYIKITPDTKYILEGVSGGTPALCFYDETKTYISGMAYGITWGTTGNVPFTSPSNAAYIRVSISKFSIDFIQLEKGESPSTYEPYAETTHTTTFPSAIYRGSEDVVNGTVGVNSDGEMWIVKELVGTEGFTLSEGTAYNPRRFIRTLSTLGWPAADNSAVPDAISNRFVYEPNSTSNPFGTFRITNTTLVFPDSGEVFADATEFNTWLSNNHTQICYKLQTPTTESITPTNLPIKSLSGYNHIESSTGDMEIDYITDAYQNFVDTTERAIPSTRKGGVKAFDIFKTLDEPKAPEAPAEESKPEEKETEEVTK